MGAGGDSLEKWATEGGREATMEEEKNCGERREGKVQNARILAKRCRSGGGDRTKGRRGVSPRKNSVAGYYSQIMVPPI